MTDSILKENPCVSPHLRNQLILLLIEEIKSYCQFKKEPFLELKENYSSFQCNSIPAKSIDSFFTAISYSSHCSSEALILSVRYLSKVKYRRPDLPVDEYTIHRLILTCLLLAIKVHDDMFVSNADYGKCCGLADVQEMNRMEAKLLEFLDFDVYVSGFEYAEFYQEVVVNNVFAKGLGIDSSVFIACSPRLIRAQNPCSPTSSLPPAFFSEEVCSQKISSEKMIKDPMIKTEVKIVKPVPILVRKPVVRLAPSALAFCCFSDQNPL
jgi:hypothetical protein